MHTYIHAHIQLGNGKNLTFLKHVTFDDGTERSLRYMNTYIHTHIHMYT